MALQVPLRLFAGSATRQSTRRIVELITTSEADVELEVFDELGHMGPVTHADTVNLRLVDHLVDKDCMQTAAVA